MLENGKNEEVVQSMRTWQRYETSYTK